MRHPAPSWSRRALAGLLVAVACAAGACRGGDAGGGTAAASGSASTVDTTDPVAEATTTTVAIVGDPVNRFTLQLGDCFNRYESLDVTTRVGCDGPHDREVFHTDSYPAPFGEPYPGDRTMQQYGIRACYAHFADFAGVRYELSRLEIGAITPTQQNFEDAKARYRGITCYVFARDGHPLTGSMRGRGE
jgi:hypothetical protein